MTLYLAQADRVRAGCSGGTCPHFLCICIEQDFMKNQLLVALTLAITTPLTNAIAMVYRRHFYMVITFGLVKLLTKIPLISLKSE